MRPSLQSSEHQFHLKLHSIFQPIFFYVHVQFITVTASCSIAEQRMVIWLIINCLSHFCLSNTCFELIFGLHFVNLAEEVSSTYSAIKSSEFGLREKFINKSSMFLTKTFCLLTSSVWQVIYCFATSDSIVVYCLLSYFASFKCDGNLPWSMTDFTYVFTMCFVWSFLSFNLSLIC